MSTQFLIESSDLTLLEKATRIANDFVQPYMNDEVVGIVFLGAIVRGYFDPSADIDIAMFKKQESGLSISEKFFKIDGIEVHIWLSDFESEVSSSWDMGKRWTYSQGQIVYDPTGQVAQLLNDKVPLKPDEKQWLSMSGLVLSRWYINDLTDLWVQRGNIISAHHMMAQGLDYFFAMLSGLNDELVADMKWRYYCVERYERLPQNFRERITDVMTLHSLSIEELARRQAAFMEMWEEMKPVIEASVQLSIDEMAQLV